MFEMKLATCATHSWGSYQNQQVVSKRPTSLGRAIPVRQGPKEARGVYLPLKVCIRVRANNYWTPPARSVGLEAAQGAEIKNSWRSRAGEIKLRHHPNQKSPQRAVKSRTHLLVRSRHQSRMQRAARLVRQAIKQFKQLRDMCRIRVVDSAGGRRGTPGRGRL